MIFDPKKCAFEQQDMVAEWPLDHAQRQNYSNVSLLFSTRKTSDVGPFLVVNTASIFHPYSRLDVHPWLQISVLRILGSLKCFQKDRIEGCFQDVSSMMFPP